MPAYLDKGSLEMKRKLFFVALVMITLSALVLTGCPTTAAGVSFENRGSFGEQIMTPAKDFITLGIVFTEVQFLITSKGTINGDTFTYQELLKEAKKLGADAIINMVIDRRTENVSSGMSSNTQQTWFGSALAIKYTETIKRSSSSTSRDEYSTTTTTTESVEFNRGGGAAATGGGAAVTTEAGQAAQAARSGLGLLRR